MADDELCVLEPSREHDPDGALLRATLEAHLEIERMQLVRGFLLRLLAALGLPLWLATLSPGVLPVHLRELCLFTWAGAAVGSLLSIAHELRSRRRVIAGEARLGRPATVSSPRP